MKWFQVFEDEATRDKRIRGLKKRHAATDGTANYIDKLAREGVVIKCISGDGAGDLGRSVKFQPMPADLGIKWRTSRPRTPQANGIAERALQQLMRIARSQLVKVGRGEDYWFFAVSDAAFKEYPANILGRDPMRATYREAVQLRSSLYVGAKRFMHQKQQQRRVGSNFHPYAKRGIVVGHDHLSPCWYVWLMQEAKHGKFLHVTFESEAKILDIVGELKAVKLIDDKDERSKKEARAQIDGDDGSGGQPTQDPT